MSLHKFAEQVAANGRGDDSLLVHMTPDEVRNLQKFAQANGTTLTINPTTGLPEAGLLSDLFKAVAPIALGAFLGPGAFGIAGLGMSAGAAAATVGGITTLATGSLSRGLMAGLGAYGGAGLAEGLAGAGTAALGQQAVASTASELMNAGAGEALTGEAYNTAMQQGVTDRMAAITPQSTWSAATQAVSADPMQFAKNNWQALAAAASPIAADLMTPTTTKMPELGNTGYIRQKMYDPYTQTYRSMAPVKANEWGDRQFSDIYRGYNNGGIVALAAGGKYSTVREDGSFDYDNVFDDGSSAAASKLAADKAAADQAAAQQAAADQAAAQQAAAAATQQGIATLTQPGANANQLAANTQFVQQAAQPNTTAAQFLAATSGAGIYNQDLADALSNSGLSAAAQYAATHSDTGTAGGILGLSQNINTALADPNLTLAKAQGLMTTSGTTDVDVERATGRASTDIFAMREAEAAAKAMAERNAAAAAAAKMAADRAAADKAAAEQAAAAKAAADKAVADKAAEDKAAADKIAADRFAADKAAADKAAAEKETTDKIAAAIAADEKAAADRAAAAKAILDAKTKKVADEDAAARIKGEAARAAYEKAVADKAAEDKAAADKLAADKAAADKLAADAAAKAAADKALADGLSLAAAAAAADKARREADAIAKAKADKAAADAAAAANVITSVGTVNLQTNTGVTQDKTDTTTLGTNTLASTTPGAIKSNITTDGTYVGTTGTPAAIGTTVGQGTVSGVGSETTTGTKGAIVDYGGKSAFAVNPLTLARQQLADQTAAANAAQNAQLALYRDWVTQNPKATDVEHANFLDKINLSPDIAAKITPYSAPQMKQRYYDAKYNQMTGDSQAAYNFLMGKGAYPTKSGVGEIMRPYNEATLGMPARTNQKYVFNPATKSYQLNRDYVGSYRDAKGNVDYTLSPNEITSYFKANQGQADSTTYDWAVQNNLTPEEIASATGVPLSTVAAKWRDAKAKKDSATANANKTVAAGVNTVAVGGTNYDVTDQTTPPPEDNNGQWTWDAATKKWVQYGKFAAGGIAGFAMGGMPMYAVGGGLGSLGSYSDGGRLLKGPGDGVSDSIPATIGQKQQPARLADGEFVVPARIVSELGNGSTEAGAKKLYAMMDRVQRARGKTTGKNKVAANSRADKYLPA